MATTNNDQSDFGKAQEAHNLVLTLPLKSADVLPLKKAWLAYAQSPQNVSKSHSALLREIVAEHIGFDLTSIKVPTKGKSDGKTKIVNQLMAKVKAMYDKEKQMDALAMSLIEANQDVSDMFTPAEIKEYKRRIAAGER
jgi:hypothetical protein